MTRRLLAVHAHPDDESSKGAATYASYASRGDHVLVVSCTGGERGDVQNDSLVESAMAERDIAGLRRIEMDRARRILGTEHRWLGYADSGLPEAGSEAELPANCFARIPLEVSAAPLVRLIREFRPHALVTYDESGGYPHPDHIRTHELSIFARDAAADATRYPHLGDAWQVHKLYYDRIFNAQKVERVHAAMVAIDHPRASDLAAMLEWVGSRPSLATSHIPVGDFFEQRDAALRAHSSQVAPDDAFFFWPNDVQREAWPFEDFQLVDSIVNSSLPEDDLFAGISTEDTP